MVIPYSIVTVYTAASDASGTALKLNTSHIYFFHILISQVALLYS